MRYTRRALLLFAAGLAFAFVVVVGEFHGLEQSAAAVMVLGIVCLPVAAAIDWRRGARALRQLERMPARRGRSATRPPASATATGRKPAPPRKSPRRPRTTRKPQP